MAQFAKPACPRCGYDLVGVVKSWRESCPLEGVCSECGLEFRWRDVLVPDGMHALGFYEQAKGVAFVSAWRTWLWTLLPWVFWKKIRAEQPVRVWRLLLWVVVLWLPLQVLHALHLAAEACGLEFGQLNMIAREDAIAIAREAISPLHCLDNSYEFPPEDWPLATATWLGITALMPLTLLGLCQTRKARGIRVAHLFRAAVLSLSWVVWFLLVRPVSDAWEWLHEVYFPRPQLPATLYVQWFDVPTLWERMARHPWMVTLIVIAWILCWWLCVLRFGFRIREWLVVWVAMVVPSVLAIAVTLCLIVDSFLQQKSRAPWW